MEFRPRRMFFVRWADVDFNGHMKNTAYLDVCVDVRLGFFAAQGFPAGELVRRRLGPVVRRDELDYFRELRLHDSFEVDLALAGASADGSRFSLRNDFYREDDSLATRVVSTGGWLDLETRKLTAPPEDLRRILAGLTRSDDYRELPSSLRSPS
jgi:acyl-CoA thioester hydrolase